MGKECHRKLWRLLRDKTKSLACSSEAPSGFHPTQEEEEGRKNKNKKEKEEEKIGSRPMEEGLPSGFKALMFPLKTRPKCSPVNQDECLLSKDCCNFVLRVAALQRS